MSLMVNNSAQYYVPKVGVFQTNCLKSWCSLRTIVMWLKCIILLVIAIISSPQHTCFRGL